MWRRCGSGVTSSQQPAATELQLKQQQQQQQQQSRTNAQTGGSSTNHTDRHADREGGGGARSPARPPPCALCLAERRRLAVAGMSPRRNRPPPALRTPSVPCIKPHRATAGTPSFVCGIEKCHVGDRDRLFGSSFSTSTGHRERNLRAALRNARALPSGASLSAGETASEGAGRSQLIESGEHYLTTTVHRNHCGRNSEVYDETAVSHMARCLTPPGAHLAHTWRTPGAGAHLAHTWRTPGAHLHGCTYVMLRGFPTYVTCGYSCLLAA